MAKERQPKPLLWSLLIAFVSILAVTGSGIAYSNWVAKENNRKFCDVLVAIDDAYAEALKNPNITPAGRRIGEEFHRLRVEFGC